MSETVIYINGLCRCCHARGNFRSLGVPYVFEDSEEIYEIVIRETFDILIYPHPGESSASTYTICESCIISLRDAARFKQQVLSCEEKLTEVLLVDDIKLQIYTADDGGANEYSYNDEVDLTPLEPKQEIDGEADEYSYNDEADLTPLEPKQEVDGEADEYSYNDEADLTPLEPKEEVDEDQEAAPCLEKSSKPRKSTVVRKRTIQTKIKSQDCASPRQKRSKGRAAEDCKTEKRDISCSICDKKLTFSRLKLHMKSHTKDKHFNCRICQNYFAKNKDLIKHFEMQHFDGKEYPCNVCSESFNTAKKLQSHLNYHFENEIVKCNDCMKEIVRKDFDQHVKIHTKKLICDICNNSFIYKQSLICHLRKHLGIKPYVCDICGQTFYTKYHMDSHIFLRHSGEKPYACNFCQKRFPLKRSRDLHETRHTGNKPCVCQTCNKGFATKSTLRIHMAMHLEEKPFPCKFCGMKFTQTGNLKQHETIHTDERKFVCEVCQQKFRRKATLNDHKKTHTDERTMTCKKCDATFKYASTLTMHLLKKHSAEKPQKKTCNICNKQLSNIYKHMRIHRDRGEVKRLIS